MIAENPEGLEMCPERIEQPNNAWKYQPALPKDYEMQELELPSIGKLTAYLKTAKAKMSKAAKKAGLHSKVVLSNGAAMNGEYLEIGMKLTGAKTIKYKDNMHTFVMEGNGYTFDLCPALNKENLPPTDFDNI